MLQSEYNWVQDLTIRGIKTKSILTHNVTGYDLIAFKLQSDTCNESSVCFETSGFCYTFNTGLSELLLNMLLLFCVMEILQLWISRSGPFPCSSRSCVVDGWWDRPTPSWFWVWMVAGMVRCTALPCPHHQHELSSTSLASLPNVVSSKRWTGSPSHMSLNRLAQGQLYCAVQARCWDHSAECSNWRE